MEKITCGYTKTVFLLLSICLIGSFAEAQTLGSLYSLSEKGQRKEVKLEKGISLANAIDNLEEQFNVVFLYRSDALIGKKVTHTFVLADNIKEALTQTLKEQRLDFTYLNPKTYGIYATDEPTGNQKAIAPLQEQINGTVTDGQSGETLPGVNILVKGTSTGTSTNTEGQYELTVENLQDTLVVSFVGYQTQEVPINGRTTIDISLNSQAIAGEELVVVGYGEMKSENITSSISSVDGEDLETSTTSSFTQGLQGKVAGMTAIQETGQPGGGMNIKIRDNPSFASSGVLYVVDGVPVNESAGEASTNTQYNNFNVNRSPLNFINPNDIESIEILKDASATSIYGARAGAGVVLITTKGGMPGETTVNYNVNYSIREATNFYNILDSREYMRERNHILKDAWMSENNIAPYGTNDESMADQFVPKYTEEQINNTTNRQSALDAITDGGMVGQHNLSISGGNSETTYYISGNYLNDDGILRKTGFKKYGGRVKVQTSFSDQIQAGINVNFNKSDADNPMAGGEGNASEGGMIRASFQYPANMPLVDSEGNYPINPDLPLAANPVSFIEIDDQTENTRLLSTAHINWNILPSLEVKGQFSYDQSSSKRGTYLPNSFLYGNRAGGLASKQEQGSNSVSMEGTVRYSTSFGENTSLNLLGGLSVKKTNFDNISGESSNYVTDIFSYHNMSAGRSNVVVGTSKSQSIWASQFMRATLNWENFNLGGCRTKRTA